MNGNLSKLLYNRFPNKFNNFPIAYKHLCLQVCTRMYLHFPYIPLSALLKKFLPVVGDVAFRLRMKFDFLLL